MIEFISIDLDNLVKLSRKSKSYRNSISKDREYIDEYKNNIKQYEKQIKRDYKEFELSMNRYKLYTELYDKNKDNENYSDHVINSYLESIKYYYIKINDLIEEDRRLNKEIEGIKKNIVKFKNNLGLGKVKLETLKLKIKNNNINLHIPGVYIIRDKNNNILYVGESGNVYNRIHIKHKMFNILYVSEMYNIIVIPIDNEIVRCQCETLLLLNTKPKYSSARKENYGQAAQLIKLSTEEIDKEANSIVAEVIKILSL